jgi:hypothetical protein
MIVGGAVDLHLVALLLPGDDDVAGVPAGGHSWRSRRGCLALAGAARLCGACVRRALRS